MKKFISYLKLALLSLAGPVMVLSCADADKEPPYFRGELEVSGTVYDDSDPARSGVGDMMVVLTSYEDDDTQYMFPIARDTAYTSSTGEFIIRTMSMSSGWIFKLTAKDNLPSREGGTYSISASYDPVLYVEFNKHSFDREEGIFRINSIAIPVTR